MFIISSCIISLSVLIIACKHNTFGLTSYIMLLSEHEQRSVRGEGDQLCPCIVRMRRICESKVGGASLRAISMAAVVSRLFPGHRLHSSFSLRPLSSLSPSLRPAQPSWRRQKSFTRCVSTATARLTARADDGNPRVLITGGAGQLGRKLAKMMRYIR